MPATWCLTRGLFTQSDRSRGIGFIRMSTVEEATKCVENLNGIVSELYLHTSSIFDALCSILRNSMVAVSVSTIQ